VRHPSGPRALALALLALLAVLAPAVAFPGGPVAADDAPAVVPATPLLSARRLPSVVQGAVADPRLAGTLGDYLDAAAGSACAAVVDGGRMAYQRDLDTEKVPASVLKLLTATAALDVLGPDTTLPTVAGAARPMADGVVDGDLFVVGGGDPLLTTDGYKASLDDPDQLTEPFAALADALVAAGLKEVRGDVVGDDSRYESVRWVETWPTRYQSQGFIGPLSALMVNDGQTGFTDTPDQESTSRKPGDPPSLAAATLTTLLEQRGVRVTGRGTAGTAPGDVAEVARIESRPVSEIVGEMITDSDNTTAELLTREMGMVAKGEGTTAAGTEVIVETLGRLGYDTTGLVLNDGSGLDPDDQVPCRLVLSLLQRSGRDSTIGRAMAVAGETGTLRLRMLHSDATGRVQAKTGTLNEVNALAGFADTPSGNAITFVMIQNGSQPDQLDWVDEYAALLMTYADAPSLEVLGPLPATS
jgi:D-alanyl-D-alanine carboxypeptidase/D-alanyl-D-alanine-endopeptidase (penicillin-binding protein 4)